MRIVFLAVAALVAAAPAMGQTPEEKAKKVTRAAKQLTGPDVAIIQDAAKELKLGGECNTVFTVGLDGKPKDIKPNCNPPDYDPYVIKAMASVTYSVELFAGEQFETEGVKQPFKFGAGPGTSMAPPPNPNADVKPPTVAKDIDQATIADLVKKNRLPGKCDISIVVGADGVPKTITPNCTPDRYNDPIQKQIAKMRFNPATKAGAPIEWTVKMPLSLGAQ